MADTRESRAPDLRGLATALGLTAIVVALAVLQVRGWDGTVNADGVSYLDLASRYGDGHFSALANGYWSPLYPMLLGAMERAARLAGNAMPQIQIALATNLGIFAAASLAYVRFHRALSRQVEPGGRVVRTLRALVAGALCIWCLLRMIGATAVTPDALLAVWLLLASADIAAAATQEPSDARHWRFGLVLALGYWTKAVFLPVAFVALFAYVMATAASGRRRATTRTLIPFFLVAAPLVGVQSWTQGRPSFGETGRLNYGWYVALLPHGPATAEPVQATVARVRRGEPAVVALTAIPRAALYTAGTEGSFPYAYDASRYDPVRGAPFSLSAQLATAMFNVHWFSITMGTFTMLALLGCAAAGARATMRPRRLLAMLPAAAMLALYGLTHPEGRLGAAAVTCIVLAITHLANVGVAGRRRPLAVVEGVALVMLLVVALGRTVKRIPLDAPVVAPTPTAASLRRAGVPRGAAVALVGSPFGQLWAHEGDVHIVAVLPAPDSLHRVDDVTLRATLAEAAARGVPLAAVIWNGDAVRSAAAVSLAPRWWALPVAAVMNDTIATASAAVRTTPQPPRAVPAAAALRRAPGPAARP